MVSGFHTPAAAATQLCIVQLLQAQDSEHVVKLSESKHRRAVINQKLTTISKAVVGK